MKLDHLKLIGKFEFSNSCALWIIKLSLKFFRINWIRIRPHIQKRNCSSQLVLQVCKSEKKNWARKVFISRIKTELYEPVFRLGRFLRDGLTFSYLWNVISSQILGVRLCMFPRSKWNVCRSLGRYPCPGLSSDAFVEVISISLFDLFPGFSKKLFNG
jgi:hypothetical protein